MKNRNSWVAALLNLVVSGLGHLYVGRAGRALIVLVPLVVAFVVLGILHRLSDVEVYLGLFAAAVAVKLFLIIDAYLIARKHPQPEPRWYMNWRAYAAFLALALVLGNVVQSENKYFGYETYSWQHDSMEPTLLQGELVLVDTSAFLKQPAAANEVVVLYTPGGVRIIRRIKAISDSLVEVVTDKSGSNMVLPRGSIEARVTGILFSPHLSRIGMKIEPPKAN